MFGVWRFKLVCKAKKTVKARSFHHFTPHTEPEKFLLVGGTSSYHLILTGTVNNEPQTNAVMFEEMSFLAELWHINQAKFCFFKTHKSLPTSAFVIHVRNF